MGKFKKDIIIFICILILASVVSLTTVGLNTIDIQFHDIYFVLDKVSLCILIIGPLTFLTFFVRGFLRKFKTIGANIGLSVGLVLIILITYHIVQLQQGYLTELMELDDKEFPDKGQFIVDRKNIVNMFWGILGIELMGFLLLTLKTIKILKES